MRGSGSRTLGSAALPRGVRLRSVVNRPSYALQRGFGRWRRLTKESGPRCGPPARPSAPRASVPMPLNVWSPKNTLATCPCIMTWAEQRRPGRNVVPVPIRSRRIGLPSHSVLSNAPIRMRLSSFMPWPPMRMPPSSVNRPPHGRPFSEVHNQRLGSGVGDQQHRVRRWLWFRPDGSQCVAGCKPIALASLLCRFHRGLPCLFVRRVSDARRFKLATQTFLESIDRPQCYPVAAGLPALRFLPPLRTSRSVDAALTRESSTSRWGCTASVAAARTD